MISIIVAKSLNNVIGKSGDLPWKLSNDLKHFAKLTRGHTVIMGRKTYESINSRLGHALPDRENIIITSRADFNAPGCVIINSIDDAIKQFSTKQEEVFVIGGGEIYQQLLPAVSKLYITEVAVECEGDTFFPTLEKDSWEMTLSEPHIKDEKNSADYTFIELVRK